VVAPAGRTATASASLPVGDPPMVAPIGRRGFVVGTAALSAGLWPLRPGHAAATMDFDEARHLLSRTTFGATPAEIRALEAQDYVATVDRLLASVRRDAVTP